jgi:hypothetical protein
MSKRRLTQVASAFVLLAAVVATPQHSAVAMDGLGCLSGGPHSTQCSIDGNVAGTGVGCSVTCSAGYYACCGVGGCDCVSTEQT